MSSLNRDSRDNEIVVTFGATKLIQVFESTKFIFQANPIICHIQLQKQLYDRYLPRQNCCQKSF